MAGNVFDQFDPAPAAAPPAADGPNVFDQFDPPAPKPASAMDTAKDVATGVGTGLVKGTAGLAGLPGDVQNMSNTIWDRASNYAIHGLLKATGQIKTPQDEADFQQLTGAMAPSAGVTGGSLPTSAQVTGAVEGATGKLPEPKTTAGQYAQTAAEFVPMVVGGPESLAKKAAYGVAAPAIASETAGQLTKGTDYEGAARLAGALGGAGAGAVAEEGMRLAGKAASKAGDALRPITSSGQTQVAADMLHSASSDPKVLADKLAEPTPQLVPGSQPTTFQATGDMGVGAAEKVAETQNPIPFNNRRTDQNNARVAVMQGIQPGGAPEDLAAGLRTHLQALDDAEAGKQAAALTGAQDAATAAGGQQSADFYGRQIQGAVQPQIDAARGEVTSALNAAGGTGTPEQYGAAMREAEQAGKDAARAQRKAFYDAVDPDGTMNVVGVPARQGAVDLEKGISPMAAQPAGEEAAILAQMKAMPDVVPFRDLQALDSRITAARTAEYQAAGESPSYARLGQLKGHVQGAISDGVANQVAYERHGIATGQMAAENGMEARLRQAWNVPDAVANAVGDARGYRAGNSGPSAGRSSSPIGSGGADVSPGGRSGQASSDPGIPRAPLDPNFDQAAADRLALAKQTHAQYAQTYKDGPTAARLKTNGFAGQYRMIDSGVPDTVFAKGPKGAEQLQTFMRAANNSPAAQGAVENYAAMSLRRAAERPDGTLDPQRFVTWANAHRDAMRANPQIMQRFSNLQRATESLQRFAPFDEAMAPSAIPEMFFHAGPSGGEGVRNLRGLIGDQMTEQSLGDYAASKLRTTAMNPDGTLDPARVAQFNKVHADALAALPGVAARFSTAARATEAVADAARARKAALDSYQRDAVGKIIGSTEPADITRMVGGIFGAKNGVAQMKDLAAKAAADPDAAQGLRKAVADFMTTRFMSNAEAGTSGTNKIAANSFQTFVRQNAPVLGQVFKPEEVKSLQAIADDITQANRSRDAINIPGQSATRQLHGMVKKAEGPEHSSWLEALFKGSFAAREVGEMLAGLPLVGKSLEKVGEHVAMPVVLGAAAVKHVVGGMRAAGMTKVQDLYEQALLNPDIARELLAKHRPGNVAQPGASFATKLTRLAPFYGTLSEGGGQQPEPIARAAGGRVEGDKRVADITGEEIAPRDASIHVLRDRARAFYEKHIRGSKIHSAALGTHVEFAGSRKAFSASADPDKLRMFAALKDIVAKGDHVSSMPPRDPKVEPSTRAYHYIEADVGTPDGHRRVGATVREDTNGHIYYNHAMQDGFGRPHQTAPEDTASKAGPGDEDDGAALGPNMSLSSDPIKPRRASGGRVEPTEAQKEAGNYKKDHTAYAGLQIAIENRKGTERRGVGKDGTPWSVTMPADYGYFKGTKGADGDHVDCYIGPKAWSPYCFIIDQVELPSRRFDEHKVMIGFATRADALKAYEAGFSDGKGKERIGNVTPIETRNLKAWATSPAASKPSRAT